MWGAIKDKCYADKPETIDVLKDNIREAIAEISQARHQNEIRKNISSAISSQQISGKNSESQIKTAIKSFSKNLSFGVDFKTVGPATYV